MTRVRTKFKPGDQVYVIDPETKQIVHTHVQVIVIATTETVRFVSYKCYKFQRLVKPDDLFRSSKAAEKHLKGASK